MPAATEIDDAKRVLRKEAAARRRDAAAADDGTAGTRLAAIFMASIPLHAGTVVSGFWPIRTEIDVRPLLRALAAQGHKLALPVVLGPGRSLEFRAWREGDAMAEGAYGIREPLPKAAALVPRAVLVPLLAFDRAGYRLGYGGGFYDRSLAGLRGRAATLAVGIAWAAQEVAAVPHDARDQQLDWIVTEREAVKAPGGVE